MEATLRELMRLDDLLPVGVFHSAMEDTTLCGYNVAKVMLISLNNYNFIVILYNSFYREQWL